MRRIGNIIIILMLCFSMVGCGDEKNKANFSSNQENIVEDNNAANSSVDREIENEIKELVSTKASAVKEKDIEKYMKTVNPEDNEYYAEQRHWFQDILVSDIEGYSLEVTKIEKKTEDSYLVSFKQQYTYEGKKNSLKYKAVYRSIGSEIFDCDLDFSSMETEHFIIKFTDKEENLAEDFAEAAEEAYKIVSKNYGKVPEDKTVIKIYNDMSTLRQFVKLSFQWDMAGWYEYSEAIKFIGSKSEVNEESLAHELIHKVTIKESNNNMPYWFAEGLAAHYSGYKIENYSTRKKMTIVEMQKTNLEKLTDVWEIRSFYDSAQEAVEFIISEYGEEGIRSIMTELAKFPFEDKTGSEVDEKNIKLFNNAAKKVLGEETKELDQSLIQ